MDNLLDNFLLKFDEQGDASWKSAVNCPCYCGNNAANCSRQRFATAIAKFGQPLTEEMLELADKLGVVVIFQAPTIYLRNYSGLLLENHKNEMRDLIQQTKNHVSVVLWSMAKRPVLVPAEADEYFRELADFVRSVDLQRRYYLSNIGEFGGRIFTGRLFGRGEPELLYTGPHDAPTKYTEMIGWNGIDNTMLGIVERSWKELRKPILIADCGILPDRRGVCEG